MTALAAAALPQSLAGWRVLQVGADDAEKVLSDRGAAEFVSCPAPGEGLDLEGTFDLLHLAAGLEGELHPLAVGAWLWGLASADATLVVQGTALADPQRSQYAEFVAPGDGGERWRWLPGRLALRWMIENSGFDFERWLGSSPGPVPGEERVAFQARRVDRLPALELARQPLGR